MTANGVKLTTNKAKWALCLLYSAHKESISLRFNLSDVCVWNNDKIEDVGIQNKHSPEPEHQTNLFISHL